MKRSLIIQVCFLIHVISGAQGLGNIFSQAAADLKGMGRQIALMQLYLGWMEKGYQIAASGLQAISNIKQAEFQLHSQFLGSLMLVNPTLKQSTEVKSVIKYQMSIKQEMENIVQLANLNPDEMDQLLLMKDNLMRDCSRNMQVLIDILSDDVFQMADDDRIRSIARIDGDMKNDWKLAKELVGEARWIAAQRQWEDKDLQSLKNLK